jgi:hypothetical protein
VQTATAAPRGTDKTELFWIYLGYDRDTEEQSQMRVIQSNLIGAAGLDSSNAGRARIRMRIVHGNGWPQGRIREKLTRHGNRGAKILARLPRHHGILDHGR